MIRRLVLLFVGCGLLVGCGTPASPTLDAVGEKAYEQQQKDANSAEGKKSKRPPPEN